MRIPSVKGRETPWPSISSVPLLLCRSGLVVLDKVWLTRQLVQWVKNHSTSTTSLSLFTPSKSKASALIPAQLHPLIIIPAAVHSLQTQAQHRLDTALARGIPVRSNERWELLLCSCSIWVLAFHATPSLGTRICSLGTDKINTSCSLGVEWENCQLSLLFPVLSFLFLSVLFSPEVSVLLYLHPTQFLVGREGSWRNRLNPILLQTSGEKKRGEKRTGDAIS